MNIFEKAIEIENAAKLSSRKGNSSPLRSSLVMPYFKGNMRKKKEGYKEIVKGNNPLTGAFIMNYFTCLAAQIVEQENKSLAKGKTKHVLTVYIVAALLQGEGFCEDDFARKHKGHKEISASLQAFAKREKLAISIEETGEIKGITQKIACSVLNYF